MEDKYEDVLHEVRLKIDLIDEKILKLLKERFDIVQDVHDIKKKHGLPIKQMGRYQEMMIVLSDKAKEIGLDQRVVHSVWQAIHDSSVHIQEDMDK